MFMKLHQDIMTHNYYGGVFWVPNFLPRLITAISPDEEWCGPR